MQHGIVVLLCSGFAEHTRLSPVLTDWSTATSLKTGKRAEYVSIMMVTTKLIRIILKAKGYRYCITLYNASSTVVGSLFPGEISGRNVPNVPALLQSSFGTLMVCDCYCQHKPVGQSAALLRRH